MDRLDRIIEDLGTLKARIEILPALDTKIDDLCTRVTRLETIKMQSEHQTEQNMKKFGIAFTLVGVLTAVYNTWRTLFG